MTTTHRILAGLTNDRMLNRNAKTGKYTIGPELYIVGSLYLSTTDLFKAAEAVVKTLNDLTEEAVNVGIVEGRDMVIVMKEETKRAFRFAGHHIGSVRPAYSSAMGKALLSELDETELDCLFPNERLQPVTKKTIKTKAELKQELKGIKETGISIDQEGSWDGVEGIASIIRNASGKAVAALSMTVSVLRMNEAMRRKLATLVRMGASLISYRLGYKEGINPVCSIEEVISWWNQN